MTDFDPLAWLKEQVKLFNSLGEPSGFAEGLRYKACAAEIIFLRENLERLEKESHQRGDKLVRSAEKIVKLKRALKDLTKHYVALVNSGDCGKWDPEEEPAVIAAREALKDDDKNP